MLYLVCVDHALQHDGVEPDNPFDEVSIKEA